MSWRLYEWLGDPKILSIAPVAARMAAETVLPPVEPSGWRDKQLPYRLAEIGDTVDFLRSYGVPQSDKDATWRLITNNLWDGVPVMFSVQLHDRFAVIGVVTD